uniref:NADH dehydrogenase subunit 6 n=1 Tax=Polycentropus flavomaculatus TaxID=185640 RepID=A0A7D6ZU91_9NEOP|nr:NADH dehydrogenase subunit 6 [Polycentropus flavomaculatus]
MIIMNLIITNSVLFMFMFNPINMGILMLIQTINSCLILNSLLNYPWLSYITFMVVIGGLMIIFIYMCILSWNSKMKVKPMAFIMIIMFMMFNFNMTIYMKFVNLNNMIMFKSKIMNLMMNNYKINLINFFFMNSMMMTILMINLLIMMLIIINKMNKNFKKPLRKMFY